MSNVFLQKDHEKQQSNMVTMYKINYSDVLTCLYTEIISYHRWLYNMYKHAWECQWRVK